MGLEFLLCLYGGATDVRGSICVARSKQVLRRWAAPFGGLDYDFVRSYRGAAVRLLVSQ